jgi:hypothetical protein
MKTASKKFATMKHIGVFAKGLPPGKGFSICRPSALAHTAAISATIFEFTINSSGLGLF